MSPRGNDECSMIDDCRDRAITEAEFKGAVKTDLEHMKTSNLALWAEIKELSKGLNSLQVKIAGIVGGIIAISKLIEHFWK